MARILASAPIAICSSDQSTGYKNLWIFLRRIPHAPHAQQTRPPLCLLCLSFRLQALICLAAMALALPISQAATPHPQISFIQLTNTSGCVGDGGSFYPTFDRLVKKVAFTSSCDLIPGKNSDGNGRSNRDLNFEIYAIKLAP
jgi:hypothetical protein